jgi:FkbM family methyltransferase
MSDAWKRIPNYLRAFGMVRGLAVFSAVHVIPRKSGSLFAVRLGERLVWLRKTASDTSVFFQILVQQEYDTREWPTLHERLVQKYRCLTENGRTPVVIDAGANIGLAAAWFAERFPQARIYAVEPEANNLLVLQRNAASFRNIVVLPGAVWDEPRHLKILNPDAGAASFQLVESEGSVRAFTIPEIIEGHKTELLIVKVDIEGGEAALFRSNTAWCRIANLLIVELHDWLYPGERSSQAFLKVAAELGADFVIRGENVFCFQSDRGSHVAVPSGEANTEVAG